MTDFIHRNCGNIAALSITLKLIVVTVKPLIDGFQLGTVDIRVPGADGALNLIDTETMAVPEWYCHSCRKGVEAEEITVSCFGCGNPHPIQELVVNSHTSPVKMECYQTYRELHPEEQLPKMPKIKALPDLIKTLAVKL